MANRPRGGLDSGPPQRHRGKKPNRHCEGPWGRRGSPRARQNPSLRHLAEVAS